MTVTEIVVSAGRTVSHPLEQYANLRPQVTLKAQLAEGEDCAAAVKHLQAQAEGLVEDHKNALIDNIVQIDRLKQQEREIANLERRIRQSQDELAKLRADAGIMPELPAASRPAAVSPKDGSERCFDCGEPSRACVCF